MSLRPSSIVRVILLYTLAFLIDGYFCQAGSFRSIEDETDENNVVQSGRVSVNRVNTSVFE